MSPLGVYGIKNHSPLFKVRILDMFVILRLILQLNDFLLYMNNIERKKANFSLDSYTKRLSAC